MKKGVVENIDAISGEVIIGSKLVELIEPDLAFVFPPLYPSLQHRFAGCSAARISHWRFPGEHRWYAGDRRRSKATEMWSRDSTYRSLATARNEETR